MKILLFLAFTVFLGDSVPIGESGDEREYVEPEYLDALLVQGDYKEFSRLMGISNPRLSMPRNTSDKNDPAAADPSFIKELFEGDVILIPELEENARQGMDFSKHPRSRWSGTVPYSISSNFSSAAKSQIDTAINLWNQAFQCLRFTERTNEKDYCFIFPGDGCYAYLGKTGGQQPICLAQNGCINQGTIAHEMAHTVGVLHEQSRPDRDDYLTILWDNIAKDWQRQYRKESASSYGIQGGYECSSVMHYPNRAPGSNKPAFEWKNNSCINPSQAGQRRGQTDLDKQKIKKMYNCN